MEFTIIDGTPHWKERGADTFTPFSSNKIAYFFYGITTSGVGTSVTTKTVTLPAGTYYFYGSVVNAASYNTFSSGGTNIICTNGTVNSNVITLETEGTITMSAISTLNRIWEIMYLLTSFPITYDVPLI